MDFLTLLTYILALVETGALVMALVYVTRAMKEKKASKNKQSPARKEYYKKSLAFVFVYLILNVIRNSGLLG